MAKQFIRHLEFYGFPDQNRYTSDINSSADLSEIIKKNKEQDSEIDCLNNKKADKKDLDELSGTVETLISAQTEFNNMVVEQFDNINSDINTLKEIDNEYGEQLSAITEGLNDTIATVGSLECVVDDLRHDVNELSGKVETLSAETLEGIAEAKHMVNEYSGYADRTFAKKEDTYSKCEIDGILDSKLCDYATKEWVEEQGYFNVEEGDERYAKKESFDELSNLVDETVEDLNAFKDETNSKIDELENELTEFSGDITTKVITISGDVISLEERTAQNEADIDALEIEVAKKANQEDLDALEDRVEVLEEKIENKVDESEFNEYKNAVADQFNDMDEKKADNTALTQVIDSVNETNNRLDQEIADRINGDNALQAEIDGIGDDIDALKEKDVIHDNKIAALESGLAQEIADRTQADLDLIGHEDDDVTKDTIWAAKNYGTNKARQAVTEAETYTDDKIAELRGDIESEFEDVDRKLTAKADVTYVDNSRNELKAELETEIADAATEERERAEQAESGLWVAVRANTQAISGNTYEIDHNANRINTITAWDGDDPAEYDNSGNGILDVLHREFHQFVETGGSIKEIKVEDEKIIITYFTPEGEKTVEFPVGELIDLSNYYTKEETDALLDEKANKDEFDALAEQVSANTEGIQTLNVEVESLNERKTDLTVFNALLQKLGYADNETLEKKHENEVAFGTYNASHTSEDASGNTVFSIGNGTSNANRSNALEVMEDGSVYMWIEGDYMNINKLLGMLAHEVYDTDILHSMGRFFDSEG